MISVVQFEWELAHAMENRDSFRNVTELMAVSAGPTVLGMVFPAEANLANKINLIEKIYENQAALFEAMRERIQSTLIDNPTSQAARRAGAIASSQNYVQLTQQAVVDARRSGAETVSYLRSNPNTGRVQARCFSECGKLIHIYRTGSGFE